MGIDFSLVDEGDNHFMVQDNVTGQQRAIAKSEIPDTFKSKIAGLPKPKEGMNVSFELPKPGDMVAQPTQNAQPIQTAQPIQQAQPEAQAQRDPLKQAAIASADIKIQKDPYQVAMTNLDVYKNKMNAVSMGVANAQAQGQQDIAAQQQKILDGLQTEQQAFQDRWNDLTQKMDTARQDVMNQKIDPGQFWKKKTGLAGFGSKVSAILGVILGGVAQIKTGVNPAMQVIQNAINEDIDAQKTNLNNKQSLLSDYYRQFGNLEAAHRATEMDMMNMMNAQIAQIGANTQSQLVKQQAIQANLELGQRIDQLKSELATKQAQQQAFSRLAGGEPTESTGASDVSMLPEEMQKRAVRLPSGQWSIAQTDVDAKELRELQPQAQSLRDTIKEMRGFLKDSPREVTNLIPFVESDKETRAKALQERAKQVFRNIMTKAGRPGEFTDKALERLIPNVSGLDVGESENKLDQLSALVEDTLSNAYQSRLLGTQGTKGKKGFIPGI